MCILSEKDHMPVIRHFLLCTSSLFLFICLTLKQIVILSTGKATPSIKNSGNINSTHILIGRTYQLLNYVLDRGLIRSFDKWIIPWSYCGVSFHLAQMNCRWNHFHINFPCDVAWISFILVVLYRFNGMCKNPHADGYHVH